MLVSFCLQLLCTVSGLCGPDDFDLKKKLGCRITQSPTSRLHSQVAGLSACQSAAARAGTAAGHTTCWKSGAALTTLPCTTSLVDSFRLSHFCTAPFSQLSTSGEQSGPTLMNDCRPGSITDLDDLVPAGAQLGTPAFLAESTHDTSPSHNYWFVVVRRSPAQPQVYKLPAGVGSETSMCSARMQVDTHWRLPAKSVQGKLLRGTTKVVESGCLPAGRAARLSFVKPGRGLCGYSHKLQLPPVMLSTLHTCVPACVLRSRCLWLSLCFCNFSSAGPSSITGLAVVNLLRLLWQVYMPSS